MLTFKTLKVPIFTVFVFLYISTVVLNTFLIYLFSNQRLDESYIAQIKDQLVEFADNIKEPNDISDNMRIVSDVSLYVMVIDTNYNICSYSNIEGMVNNHLSSSWNPSPEVYFNSVLDGEQYIIMGKDNKYYSIFYQITGITTEDSLIMLKKINDKQFLIAQTSTISTLSVTQTINKLVVSSFLIIFPVTCFITLILVKRATYGINVISRCSEKISKRDFVKIPHSHIKEVDSISSSINHISTELQKYDMSQKNFISNVSHELKTPISIISAYAEALKIGMAKSPEDLDKYCKVILDECDKTNKLIVNMITLLKSESLDYLYDNVERMDIDKELHDIFNRYLLNFTKFKIDFKETRSPDCYINANRALISTVLENLCSNAFKYCKEQGTIATSIIKTDSQIEIHIYNDTDDVNEDNINKLWERFYRVESARTRDSSSTGIGLSIVKALCEKSGIQYYANNIYNGIEFVLILQESPS